MVGGVLATLALSVARAPPPTMSNVFRKRTFFISAPFVGNNGFDPLKLASSDNLVPLRHAEVKHGRLAMLAAVAWPAAEALHPRLAHMLGARDLLEATHGMSPSIFVGGLDRPEVAPALGMALVLGAAFDLRDVSLRAAAGLRFNEYSPDSVAGDLGFDPLQIATNLGVTDRFELQEAEIINGRLAQLALLAYAFIEGTSGVPIIGAAAGLA